ncbi:hypothetical protein ES707_19142 [subsurface metagenome]
MATQRRQGEPYEISGKRIAFTNYHYIRPAGFGWYDDQGKGVAVIGNQGPWDAHIRVFERPFGIQIRALPAGRFEKPHLLEPKKPWEGSGVTLNHILYDEEDGYFKAWGTCSTQNRDFSCYLQSHDFESWERPELGIVEFGSSRKNNLIETGKDSIWHGSLFKDPSDPKERWKFLGEGTITRKEYDAYCKKYPKDWDPKSDRVDVPYETHIGPGNMIAAVKGAVSEDGFRWTFLPEPLVVEHSDTLVTAYYDTRLKKYVGYFRDWMVADRSPDAPGDRGLSWMVGRRSIGRAETDNFHHFPLSEIIFEPGPEILGPSDVLYTNCHTFVPHTSDQHLFFPTIWHMTNDATSIAIASSSDGKVLHWLPGSPILITPPFMEWDGGCIFAGGNLLELPDGSWALPYSGSNFPHKYPRKGPIKHGRGFATWKKGRMVAVEAKELGQFTTFAFMAPGTKMRINALTSRGGNIKVEVTDLKRQVIPGHSFDDCKPIIGDQYLSPVIWNSSDNIGVPKRTPICLRFKLDQAQLFFVDFE